MALSDSSPYEEGFLPAMAAGSSGRPPSLPTADFTLQLDPDAFHSLMVGTLVAVAKYEDADPADVAARLSVVIADADLIQRITDQINGTKFRDFSPATLGVHPYWVASAVLVIAHPVVAAAQPRPTSIGGFALTELLPGAIWLAYHTAPFDLYCPALRRLAKDVPA